MDFISIRLGNYLKTEPLSIPRMGISSDGVVEITAMGIHLLEKNDWNGHSPIELNHFWFKQFGFVRKEYEFAHHDGAFPFIYEKKFTHENKKMKFKVYADDTGTFFSMYDNAQHDLQKKKYVHDLQNIYLDFTEQPLKRP